MCETVKYILHFEEIVGGAASILTYSVPNTFQLESGSKYEASNSPMDWGPIWNPKIWQILREMHDDMMTDLADQIHLENKIVTLKKNKNLDCDSPHINFLNNE